MSNYKVYSNYLAKSVHHIFRNLFADSNIEIVYDSQIDNNMLSVSVDMAGSIKGELILHFPKKTVLSIYHFMYSPKKGARISADALIDVASELSNMITGTFVNQMQFIDHQLDVSPPELLDGQEEYIRTLYENVNLSFRSSYGGFDLDFYFRETRQS